MQCHLLMFRYFLFNAISLRVISSFLCSFSGGYLTPVAAELSNCVDVIFLRGLGSSSSYLKADVSLSASDSFLISSFSVLLIVLPSAVFGLRDSLVTDITAALRECPLPTYLWSSAFSCFSLAISAC